MVTLDALRAERREEILRLAERRGAHNLRVFGSVARGDANENSDLDLLVAWEQGRSLLDHAGLVQTGSFARPTPVKDDRLYRHHAGTLASRTLCSADGGRPSGKCKRGLHEIIAKHGWLKLN